MNLTPSNLMTTARREGASVLIIVLWVCIGMVSIALYFANSMNYELKAADNRVNGLAAEEAIEGAARYVSYALSNYATNGAVPDNTQFACAAVPVGDAHFWIIGRDPSITPSPSEPYFALIDEGSKINLNRVGTNTLSYLPNITTDFAQAVVDWRNTNGLYASDYTMYGYPEKQAPFESVDELRLVEGATEDMLVGDDLNRNGVLDLPTEKDEAGTGQVEPGLIEYTTVYSREPNTHSDGSTLTNVNTGSLAQMRALFQNANIGNGYTLGGLVYTNIHGRTSPPPARPANLCTSMLDFYLRCYSNNVTSQQFGLIYDNVTISTNSFTYGRVNINTASQNVLIALFMGSGIDENTAESAAENMAEYRDQNRPYLTSVAWMVDALGAGSPVVTTMKARDLLTTHSFQFTADIAAVGAYGRGYRRVKFIFDVSEGSPKILYRQDLSRLGWALGTKARQTLMAKQTQ
jgi:DNA uptake protein ComE-like DNA-binding protein